MPPFIGSLAAARRSRAPLVMFAVFAAACSDGGPTDPGGNGTGDRLPGGASALAATAIPDRRFEARARDYSTSHPELPGLYASFNTLMFATTPTATVGTVNALLDEIDATIVGGVRGVAQQSGGILFLRVPVTTHADMEAALTVLRASPAVAAVSQDVLVQGDLLPRAGSAPQEGWSWELVANGGNWGLELARMPQAWNLNAAIVKARGPAFSVPIGVIDEGFASSHVDVVFAQTPTGPAEDHGTFVAGIIGANFDNGVGINGVTPFAALVPRSAAPNTNPGDPILERLRSVGQLVIDQFGALVRAQPQMPVVNMSVGYNWVKLQPEGGPLEPGVIPSQSAKARQLADDQGALFKVVLETLQAENGRLPLVVVSAGNNSGGLIGEQQARYNSPMANAAIRLGARNVIVAEGVMQLVGSAAPLRFVASDRGGHLSAAAFNVRSTIRGDDYAYYDGTSFAAPQIAGVAGFLFALDPDLPWATLTQNPVLDALTTTARPVNQVAPHVDAFAAALQVDVVRQNDRVLRLLLDVDDGSLDGNLRVDLASETEITDDDQDGDGGPGDGAIDMSDFRRWRDWLLQAEGSGTLNGSADHPKKDLNGDGRVQDAAAENLYPRGDFNGDGVISRVADRLMSGVLGGQTLTDLEVLQELFEDTYYSADVLSELVTSGDVTVNAASCLQGEAVVGARSTIEIKGSGMQHEERMHEGGDIMHIYTVPVDAAGYRLRIRSIDDNGAVVAEAEKDLQVTAGDDQLWEPECVSRLSFRFDEDFDSWSTGTAGSQGADSWGTTVWLSRDGKGVVKLDGTGDPGAPNSWIYRSIALPEDATRMTFEASAHNRDGADAILRVRLVDAQGASHTLFTSVLTGAEGVYLWSDREVSVAAYAGQTVIIYFEQDDNGFQGQLPGGHEQVYLDNIVIHSSDPEA